MAETEKKNRATEYAAVAADPKTTAKREDAFARLVKAQAELVAMIILRVPADSPEIVELNSATAQLRQYLGV